VYVPREKRSVKVRNDTESSLNLINVQVNEHYQKKWYMQNSENIPDTLANGSTASEVIMLLKRQRKKRETLLQITYHLPRPATRNWCKQSVPHIRVYNLQQPRK